MATNFSERFSMDAKVGGELETGFMGTTQYNFCNLIEEHYNATRHDMTGVFEAYRFDRNTNEGTHCVLMICEQLNPGLLDDNKKNSQLIVEDTTQQTSCSTRYWENRLIFDSCFNPNDNGSFIENFTQIQKFTENETTCHNSFPGGYLDLFAAAMPSELKIIGDMPGFLREEDLLAIKLQLYKLPASRRNFVVSSSFLSCSASSDLYSSEFLYRMATIWYDRDSKQIWVPEDTLTNWYARKSASDQQKQQKQRASDPQKQFEEFWLRLVKSWEYCCRRWGYAPDVQKVLSSSSELCFRDREDSTASPSSTDKGWTMIEDGKCF